MSSVWYVGKYTRREISVLDWATSGVTAQRVEWNRLNGWSIPESDFTSQQLLILDGDVDFLLGQPDGPRDTPSPPTDPDFDNRSSYAYYRELKEIIESGDVPTAWVETLKGQDGTPGEPGAGVVGVLPSGESSAQFYISDGNGGEIPLGDPIPVAVNWTTVTFGTDLDTPRPPVDASVIWIGQGEANQMQGYDILINTSVVAPTIITTVLNGMNVNAPFSQMLYADGTIPQIWSKKSGTFPPGIQISTEGQLFGNPTSSGSYTFELQSLNPGGVSTHTYNITVGSAIAPTINTTTLGTIQAGSAFSVPLSVSGSAPITLALKPGDTLPSGFVIDPDPLVGVHGTAPSPASYSFNVRATNVAGYDDQLFSGNVVGTAPTITTVSLGQLYRAISAGQTLAASGSTPITWSKISGSFPSNVSINSSGVVSGSPDTVQSYSFVMQAHNAYGDSATVTFSGNVLESTPNIAETSMGSLKTGATYSKTLTLSQGGPTVTWSQSGTLPAGISWDNTTHTFSGTPTAISSSTLTIRATNTATGEYDDQVFSWSVTSNTVGFDAVGTPTAGAASGTTTVNTPSTMTAGADVLLIMEVDRTCTFTVTPPAGATATLLKNQANGASGSGTTALAVYRIVGAAAGAAISVALSASTQFIGICVSYNNVVSIANSSVAYGASNSPALASKSVSAGNLLVGIFGYGYYAAAANWSTFSGGSKRYSGNANTTTGICVSDSSTNPTVFSTTLTASHYWAAVHLELSAS